VSLPTVLYVGPAALCALAWLGAGSLVPARLLPDGLLARTLTRLAGGSVAFSVGLLSLGRVGLFDRAAVVSLTAVLAVPGALAARALVRRPRLRDQELLVRALLAVIVLALLLDLVAASTPPTSPDALRYHLALPERWLQLGRIDDSFWNWQGIQPFGIELLFGQGLALAGGPAAGAVGALIAGLAGLAAFALARELGGGSLVAGTLGAALAVLQGIVTWEATGNFVELGLTFYALLAALLVVRYARTRAGPDAAWAGVAAGAAAGVKYHGLVAVGLALLALALLRAPASHLAGALGLAAAAGGAWYLKNAIVAGNPIYPLVFGGRWWTPTTEAGVRQIRDGYGYPHASIARLAILPIDLLVHGDRFDRGRYVGTAIFLAAPAAYYARRQRAALVVVLAAAVYAVAWWTTSQQARFLLPALGLAAAAGGAGLARLVARHPGVRPVLLAVLVAVVGVWGVSSVALTRQLVPVAVGAESRSHFLQRLTGTYRTLREVRERVPGVLGLAGYPFSFNYPGRAIGLEHPAFTETVSRREYVRRLRAYGVHDVLVSDDAAGREQIAPIRGCATRLAAYHVRVVTSRTRGTTRPFVLTLLSTARC
jgi:hypothetical protein